MSVKTKPIFQEFLNSLRAVNALEVNRNTTAHDWITTDGIQICHERAHFPWSPFKEPSYNFWSEPVYTDKSVCERDAAKYGGRVEMCFYCDEKNPIWFIIFDELDKAAALAYHFLFEKVDKNGLFLHEGEILNKFEPPCWANPEMRKEKGLPVTVEDYLKDYQPEKLSTRFKATRNFFNFL